MYNHDALPGEAMAREGSLTGASEVLHVTQPAMSRQVQEPEEELGQKPRDFSPSMF